MPATAYRDHDEARFDPASLADDLAALRQQLRTLASDLRDSQRENAGLRQELDRRRARDVAAPRPAERRAMPEAQRFQRELAEQLARLRRVAAARAVEPEAEAPAPRTGDAAWLRRMMVVMMMAELV